MKKSHDNAEGIVQLEGDAILRERVHTLWDRLADFDAGQADEALAWMQDSLCRLIGADNTDWFGAMRIANGSANDIAAGWRPGVVRLFHANPAFEECVRRQKTNMERGEVNDVVIRMVALAGRFRALRLCDLEPPEWFAGPFYQTYYRDNGYDDAIYVATPVNGDAESYVGLFRAIGRPPFTAAERDLAGYALRGLKWFQRRLLLNHGLLVADSPLTPLERQVLQGVLDGLTEKDIARRMERSFHTVHEYIRSLYGKFGVNNRAALMALWLGRTP